MADIQGITDINNLMGKLIYEVAFGDIRHNYSLFFEEDRIIINIQGHYALDKHSAIGLFDNLEKKNLLSGNFHLLHSNAYKIHDKATIIGHWNTYSFFKNDKEPYSKKIRFGYLRFLVKFHKKDNNWKITELECDELMTFEPEACCLHQLSLEGKKDLTERLSGFIDPENYILLRNLVGSFVQNGPGEASNYFSENNFSCFHIPEICIDKIDNYNDLCRWFKLIAQKEKTQQLYHYLMTATTPIIVMDDERHSHGIYLSQILTFDRNEDGKTFFELNIGVLYFKFIKTENIGWRISSIQEDLLIGGPLQEFSIPVHRPMAMLNDQKWPLAPKLLYKLTDSDICHIFKTESFLPQWTERLKRGETADFIEDYMKNDEEEIFFCMASGQTCGYEKAKSNQVESHKKFGQGTMTLRFPQFHTGNAPVASVSEDGKYIDISWMEWGWGNIGYGIIFREEECNRTYTPMIGQYHHKFVNDNGIWKQYYFGWTPLLQGLPSWSYNTQKVRGWASKPYKDPWPLPFEPMK